MMIRALIATTAVTSGLLLTAGAASATPAQCVSYLASEGYIAPQEEILDACGDAPFDRWFCTDLLGGGGIPYAIATEACRIGEL
ncbi:hypothetical protein [Actinosynnema sp. NPDC020468]|uniref:hypothetical protein n=1 Tax=Actinosynnema sp. NPDC020468 TaxID=3154488 RepID=UPI00340221A3